MVSLNLDLDLRFSPMVSLNLGPNLGLVQAGSGLNRGSEPNIGITTRKELEKEDSISRNQIMIRYSSR